MSLQDQLLKSGLTTKNKVQQERTAKRKQRKGGQSPAATDDAVAARARVEQARAEKIEKDRLLNQQREAQRIEREQVSRIRQLIDSHRLSAKQLIASSFAQTGGNDANALTPSDGNDADAATPFSFTADGKVRRLRVSASIRQQLISGALAIVRTTAADGDYAVVGRSVAEDIFTIDEQAVALMNDRDDDDNSHDDEDPYAGYEVPDDLVW